MVATVMDQDMTAIEFAHDQFKPLVQNKQLEIIHGNFADFKLHCHGTYDAILLDLGVSSPQLDEKSRGFSFYDNGPLDMRMNQGEDLTAAHIVNTYSEDALLQIFHRLGEISHPGRVVRAIVKDRTEKAFVSTEQLAGLIERVDGWKTKGFHPATQYFMALRLAVNNELNVIETVLPHLVEALNEGGRLAIISFHSLEDRIIKYFMRESTLGYPLQKKVITPTEVEEKANPRSRSAKLRVFVKGLPPPKKNKYPKTEN
jgi:16S rRNA (cytosine1402-N4)-methyltransferase